MANEAGGDARVYVINRYDDMLFLALLVPLGTRWIARPGTGFASLVAARCLEELEM